MNTQKIAEALHAAGYKPTEQLIQAVASEKATDGRISMATAVRRAVQTAAPDNGQTSGQRVSDSGQSAQSIDNPLEATTQALADSMKKAIVSEALNRVVSDLKAGDFGSFVNVPLGESGALDVDFSEVLDLKPFRALSPATVNNSRLLSASNENENSDASNI